MALGVDDALVLPGFIGYRELPVWYGYAACLVHPSTTEQWGLVVNEAMASGLPVLVSERCGCASDLVENGRNGFTFNPYDMSELADRMLDIAKMKAQEREAMGNASQAIIAGWSPETFADGLQQAVDAALEAVPRSVRLADKLVLRMLSHR
jgi:glycosyltransferase involved in cell wall biosynthesis